MPTPEFAASFGHLAANHLWQSTGFAAVAVLLALALRANYARARYWLWLAASVKFLVPFSVLAAIGTSLGRWFVPATPVSRFPFVMEQIVQPFTPFQDAALPSVVSAPGTTNLLPALLLALWLCGFVAVLLYGWVRWRRVASAVRSSTPLTEGRELEALRKVGQAIRLPKAIRLVSSTAKLEPGVFGIFRPVLWLPAGIGDRLEDAELEAILAHELCHICRRDNLLSAIHMAVEAIFWFHPLVWWLGARLEEERERACDEEVVRMGGEPQIYAESILKVCEFYLASPVACAAGVTGGELKKRIEGIMTNRFTRKLSYGKKILLAAAAVLVIAVPIVVGLLNPPRSQAQSPARVVVLPASAGARGLEGTGQATQQTAPSRAAADQRATQNADVPVPGIGQPPNIHPTFEVASVKPAGPPSIPSGGSSSGSLSGSNYRVRGGPGTDDPGQFTAPSVSLLTLVEMAYGVRFDQVSGPGWLSTERYSIVAKLPPKTTKDQFSLMLQNLLSERFHMTLHHGTKDFPAYELLVANGGPKMKPLPPDADAATAAPLAAVSRLERDKSGFLVLPPGVSNAMTVGNGMNRWTFSVTMGEFAERLGNLVNASNGEAVGTIVPVVVDRTGLTGKFDFTLEFVGSLRPPAYIVPTPSASRGDQPPEASVASDPGPTLFQALEKQLGLKLEKGKTASLDLLVIDRVEKEPTAN